VYIERYYTARGINKVLAWSQLNLSSRSLVSCDWDSFTRLVSVSWSEPPQGANPLKQRTPPNKKPLRGARRSCASCVFSYQFLQKLHAEIRFNFCKLKDLKAISNLCVGGKTLQHSETPCVYRPAASCAFVLRPPPSPAVDCQKAALRMNM